MCIRNWLWDEVGYTGTSGNRDSKLAPRSEVFSRNSLLHSMARAMRNVAMGALGNVEPPSLPLHPGPLWPGMVAPDRALSMG